MLPIPHLPMAECPGTVAGTFHWKPHSHTVSALEARGRAGSAGTFQGAMKALGGGVRRRGEPHLALEWLSAFVEFMTNTAFYAYLVVFAIGLAWIAIGLLMGGLSSMMEVAHDVATDISHGGDAGSDTWGHQQIGLSPFSPLMLAVFGMLFGMSGMALTLYTGMHPLAVLGITLAIAVLLDGGVYWGVLNFFVKSQSSSLPNVNEAIGSYATIATRVGPGMVGSITYEAAGRRAVASAHADDGRTYEPGEVVEIRSMTGGIARVTKKEN